MNLANRTLFLITVVLLCPPAATEGSPPAFDKRLNFSHVGYVNGEHKFTCNTKGSPKPSLIWYYNGEPLQQSDRIKIKKYSLTISNLRFSDSGSYSCLAKNPLGMAWGNFSLRVMENIEGRVPTPPLMADIANQTAIVGETVTFECTIIMSGSHLLLQWLRHHKINGSFVNEKGEPYVKILQKSGFESTVDDPRSLVLRNVSEEDQGWYTCLVANTIGMNYRSAYLEVLGVLEQELVTMIENMENQTAVVGDNVTLTCKIIMSAGDTAFSQWWLRHFKDNDCDVSETREAHVKILQRAGPEGTRDDIQRLVLYNVRKEDQDWYTCMMATSVGMYYKHVYLTVSNETETLEGRDANNESET